MEPVKDYNLKEKQIKQLFIIGAIAIILGLLIAVLTGGFMLIGIGILNLVIGVLNKRLKIVQIFPDHFEIQKGVIASKKLIKYNQLTGFTRSKKDLEINYTTNEGREEIIKMHINALEKEDIQEISNTLKEKTNLGDENHFNLLAK